MARSFNDCLNELRSGGGLSDAEWSRLSDEFNMRRNQHRMNLGDEEAAFRAGAEMEADLRREAFEKQRRLALTKGVRDRLKETLTTFRRGDGKPDRVPNKSAPKTDFIFALCANPFPLSCVSCVRHLTVSSADLDETYAYPMKPFSGGHAEGLKRGRGTSRQRQTKERAKARNDRGPK